METILGLLALCVVVVLVVGLASWVMRLQEESEKEVRWAWVLLAVVILGVAFGLRELILTEFSDIYTLY